MIVIVIISAALVGAQDCRGVPQHYIHRAAEDPHGAPLHYGPHSREVSHSVPQHCCHTVVYDRESPVLWFLQLINFFQLFSLCSFSCCELFYLVSFLALVACLLYTSDAGDE